ncbi:MAG TPA: PH domain-containing protein [Jatrophihabitans sp.]|nr:PH domain-containing protein [Jatrophihabitans sp.]
MSFVGEQLAGDTVGAATWHRLDPRMLLIHPIVEVGRALPALAGVFLAGSSQGHNYWGLLATGVVAAASLTRWFTTRLRITPESVQLRHGLLHRRTITTARDRIRTVDLTAHPLHRLLGLARVVIGTGTNDRKGEGRLVLDGLTVSAAGALRDDLLHNREVRAPTAVGPAAQEAAHEATQELVRLDRQWIRYAPFTLSGVVTGLVIWGFYWRVQGESGVDVTRYGPLRSIAHALHALPTAAEVLVVVAAVGLFVAITSTAGYLLAFWNFRLARHPGGSLQVTRGLLTTRATSIERRRLVGVTTSASLPLRAVGAARVSAVATGLRTGRGSERGGEVLLPPAPRAVAESVAGQVLDGATGVTTALRPHGPAARRRRLLRAMLGGAVLCAAFVAGWLAGAPIGLLVLGGGLLACSVPLGLDRYRSLGHDVVGRWLVTGWGSLIRQRVVLDGHAVIGWNLRSTWFQRRAGLVTLVATTAAGRQGYPVPDVGADEAIAVADAVTPGLLDPFRAAR